MGSIIAKQNTNYIDCLSVGIKIAITMMFSAENSLNYSRKQHHLQTGCKSEAIVGEYLDDDCREQTRA